MGDSAQLHSDLEALVGATLHDRYRVDSLLGVGGMGAVFKARHTGLERDVAIKVLHPEIGRDASVSKRFDREATSASRLDHPNCVRVTDFGTTENGTKYLVMEMLEGSELEARLGRPWAPAEMIETAKQILAGLEHAHHFGIVHRDLKPENVFITKDFRGEELVKLVDFGIAKLIDEQGAEKLTRQGIVFGTPRYMSPEQAAGGKIDERTDLYAAGLIFYEMLAGAPPFDTDDAAQLLRMQIMAPPPPLPDGVPTALAKVVEKLLEKSKADRYANAREVIEALDAAAESLAAAGPAVAAGVAAHTPAASATAPTSALSQATIASSPTSSSSSTGAAAARSGAAWQPAPTVAPVRSGGTILSSSQAPAAVVTSPTETAAYSTGSHPQLVATRTGSHPGVGQPATGPFDSLAGASAAGTAEWTGSHPALGHAAGTAGMSGATAIAIDEPPQAQRRSWVPWAIAGTALLLALGAVGFALSSLDDGDKAPAKASDAASKTEPNDTPAAPTTEAAAQPQPAPVEPEPTPASAPDPPAESGAGTDSARLIPSLWPRGEGEHDADGAPAGAGKKSANEPRGAAGDGADKTQPADQQNQAPDGAAPPNTDAEQERRRQAEQQRREQEQREAQDEQADQAQDTDGQSETGDKGGKDKGGKAKGGKGKDKGKDEPSIQ